MADNTDAVKDCGPVATPTGNDCWSEYLPKVNRSMSFRVTARDGNAEAGGNGFADTLLTVSGGAGPFRLTSQATNTDNGSATTLPVTWDVAGTNAAPINTANVRILLSTDDGATFSTVLAGSTPNDGSEAVPLPAGVQTTTARIRIEGVGNVFYDVSRGQLSFDRTKEPPPSGGGGGGGTSGGGTTTTTSTPTTPTTPPLLPVTPTGPTSASIRLSAAKVQNFLRTGVVTVKVTVDRDAALTATGAIALGRAKATSAASLKLKSAKGSATAGKATTLKLKLTARDKTRLRSAVRARRTATAKISVKVSPPGLPPTTEKATVRQKGA
jgi:hypothetical protein